MARAGAARAADGSVGDAVEPRGRQEEDERDEEHDGDPGRDEQDGAGADAHGRLRSVGVGGAS